MINTPNSLQFIKPSVRAGAPVPRTGVAEGVHRLQWNENPYDYPADLKEEVLRRMARRAWAHYPDGLRPLGLIDLLARQCDVLPEQVVVSSGSSSLIKIVLTSVLQPGDRVVMPSPTFLLYRRNIALLGAQVHEIPLLPEDNFALPVAELVVTARTNEAKLIAVCAPNNPTGTVYSVDDLRRLADEGGALLMVDEAYAEFCGQDLRPLLDEFDNVVLVRTFSKAYAMAGQRVGYALAHPALAVELDKGVNSFPVSTFSETVATVALEHQERFMSNVARIVGERERMSAALAEISGVRLFPSGTNFLLVQFDDDPSPIFAELQDDYGILISDMISYPGLHNCLRISIGLPEDNDQVIASVRNGGANKS